ncbi:hypothetical protein EVAR_5715_1 [Eumeta japonica]|uniref:Uncharacterized protein n=1 Tax=Eumeta variegata TaxID=151549 RepID=A0A4C1TAA3_EUMVA|nr:hypothetical protein EVAR_5715_1 [Eumeta japonica]
MSAFRVHHRIGGPGPVPRVALWKRRNWLYPSPLIRRVRWRWSGNLFENCFLQKNKWDTQPPRISPFFLLCSVIGTNRVETAVDFTRPLHVLQASPLLWMVPFTSA